MPRPAMPPASSFVCVTSSQIRRTHSNTLIVHYIFRLDDGSSRQAVSHLAHAHGLSPLIHDYWNTLPHFTSLQFCAFHEGFI
jgi:hypothetical protein